MEFCLDLDLVRSVLRGERARTHREVSEQGVVDALERSQQRHDSRMAAAPDYGTLACRSGCAWCCYFSVDVRAVEVFRILDYVASSLTTAEQARIAAEVRVNTAQLTGLDEEERATRNVKCPFLSGQRCTIY